MFKKRGILKPITRSDKRTGDEYIRQWIATHATITEAERVAGLCKGNLRIWLHEPFRKLTPDNALRLARAAHCPTEAIQYRDTPIRDLDFWKMFEQAQAS